MTEFIIPADYCVALVDVEAYPSFLDKNWTLEQISSHFVAQMNLGTMIAWGTGAPGNWNIHSDNRIGIAQGYREFTVQIFATGSKLYLISYDDLAWAAQYEDKCLPDQGIDEWFIEVEPGEYKCRIVQLYDPKISESEELLSQKTPHFKLEIVKGYSQGKKLEKVPWFL